MAARGKGARTRRRILMCAAEVIASRGVSGMSLSDVVEAANVSKGALYFHFSSKDELLIAVEELYNADSRRMIEQVGQDPDPLRRLIRLSLALARRQYRDRLAIAHNRMNLSRAAPPMPSDLETIDWAGVVRTWLADGLRAGYVTPGPDLQSAAELIDDCVLGVVTASMVERRSASRIGRMAGFWRLMALPGLVPDPERRRDLTLFLDELEAWSEAEVRRSIDAEAVDDGHAEPGLPDARRTPDMADADR